MSHAVVTIDLGNSSCKLCAWESASAATVFARATLANDADLVSALREFLGKHGDAHVAVCGVGARDIEAQLRESLRALLGARFLGTPQCGLENATLAPESVGADRLFAARGAYEHVRGSAIVVDAGTALTVDALEVRARPRFLGGAIAPGPQLLAAALAQGTARLPHVDVSSVGHALGRDTREAIAAGVMHGFRGAARELVRAVASECSLESAPIVVTGGARISLLTPPLFDVEPLADADLVHSGLRHAALDLLRSRGDA